MDIDIERVRLAIVEMRGRLAEAEQIARRFTPKGPHKLDALDRMLPAIHRRVRRAAVAVHELLQAGLAYEAAIVARSLFEDSLRLGMLHDVGPRRTELLLGWMHESTRQAERLLREGAGESHQNLVEVQEALKIRRAALEGEARRFGVTGRSQKFPDERTMAARLGRLSEFPSYLLATHVTHGAETAFMFDPDPVGDTSSAFPEPSLEVAGAALSLSVVSVLKSHIDVAGMLGWEGVPEARALLDAPLRAFQT